MYKIYKCKHLLEKGIVRRGKRVPIKGWNAIVCEDCYSFAKDMNAHFEILFMEHGTYQGDPNDPTS